MIYKVDLTKSMWRYLYHEVYNRIYNMGIENSSSEQDILNRIIRLQAGDRYLYLLVELKDSSIVSHCLINIIGNVAFVEQTEAERKRDSTFVKDCEDYICTEIKKDHPNITEIALSTHREEYRAFERKYGFHVAHIIMKKDIKPVTSMEEVHE